MTKKKNIIVTIKEVKRKSKRLYQVTIDLPGNNPDDSPREYYASVYSAKRGAKRKLNPTLKSTGFAEVKWGAIVKIRGGEEWRPIEFVIVHKTKKAK